MRPASFGRLRPTTRAHGIAVLLLLVASCRTGDKSRPAHSSILVKAEFAGCAAVHAGPVCLISPVQPLRVWVPQAAGKPEASQIKFFASGQPLATAHPTAVAGGLRFAIPMPDGATELTLRTTVPNGEGEWRLRLEREQEPAWLARARELRSEGKLSEAEAALAPGLAEGSEYRGQAFGLLARIQRMRGDLDKATELFLRAIEWAQKSGRASDQANDAFALCFAHAERLGDLTKAKEALALAEGALSDFPEGRAKYAYYRAHLSHRLGDYRAHLEESRQALELARRLGMDEFVYATREYMGVALLDLGRPDDALAVLIEASDPAWVHACDRARMSLNTGLAHLMAAQLDTVEPRAQASLLKAKASLERAVALSSTECRDKYLLVNSLVDLARADILAADLKRAQVHVDRLRAAMEGVTGAHVLQSLEVEARLALARRGYRSAYERYRQLATLATASFKTTYLWQASLGTAEALEGMGKLDQAREAYAAAEDLLDDASLAVPLNEGRGMFLTQRQSGATYLVDLLVRMRLPREAWAAARRSRARVLRQLQLDNRLQSLSEAERKRWEQAVISYRREREQIDSDAEEDWTLSPEALADKRKQRVERERRIRGALDEALAMLAGPTEASPAAPPPGVLVLTYHPIRNGWAAFATNEKGTRSVTLREKPDSRSPDQLSRLLLEPFRREIEAATRIQVAPFGVLRDIDFHALPWKDSVLLEAAPVAYSLDLPRRDAAADAAAATVLIVTDPAGNLPAGRKEGAEVSALLREKQWNVRWLQGQQATKQALLESLSKVQLLHYAGHGVYQGQDGWESVLPLANHTNLTVGDILALPHPPRQVVLSACESGRSSARAATESLGIAQAFVTAGSEAVVATVRRVDDRLAADVSRGLHERIATGRNIDLPAALREVQLSLAKAGAGDWQAYRVVTR